MLLVLSAALPGGLTTAQEKPTIKYAPPEQVAASDGPAMFRAYCAVCHGLDGSGGGPAAEALRKVPADLTQLTRRNGGKFPRLMVLNTIQGADRASHGSRQMPIWGNAFHVLGGGDAIVKLRVANLATYLESIQRP